MSTVSDSGQDLNENIDQSVNRKVAEIKEFMNHLRKHRDQRNQKYFGNVWRISFKGVVALTIGEYLIKLNGQSIGIEQLAELTGLLNQEIDLYLERRARELQEDGRIDDAAVFSKFRNIVKDHKGK